MAEARDPQGSDGGGTSIPRPGDKRRIAGKVLAACAVALLAGGLGVGAWNARDEWSRAQSAAKQQRDFVPKVQVARVQDAGATIAISLPGTTQAFTTANIFARASGYIDKRNVDIGDVVRAGQVLAQVTAPELDHQIEQAKATLEQNRATLRQAQANRDLAQITWNRDRPLVAEGWTTRQQGSIDQQNLSALDASVSAAKDSVSAQEALLRTLGQQKAYQTVVAPFDGVVTQRNIDVGSLVQADATAGTFMFTLMQTGVIRTFVYVPQDQVVGVGPGVEAAVHVPELPGRSFPGTVTRIADALQPDTRTLLTEIDVPNPDGELLPGVYCSVELQIPRKQKRFVIPSDAIVFDGDGLHVAVLEDGVARFRNVQIVHDFGTTVEVDEGIKSGDMVIRTPAVNLADGSRVEASPVREAEK
jgi:RND family efflux transporter MFP subunit